MHRLHGGVLPLSFRAPYGAVLLTTRSPPAEYLCPIVRLSRMQALQTSRLGVIVVVERGNEHKVSQHSFSHKGKLFASLCATLLSCFPSGCLGWRTCVGRAAKCVSSHVAVPALWNAVPLLDCVVLFPNRRCAKQKEKQPLIGSHAACCEVSGNHDPNVVVVPWLLRRTTHLHCSFQVGIPPSSRNDNIKCKRYRQETADDCHMFEKHCLRVPTVLCCKSAECADDCLAPSPFVRPAGRSGHSHSMCSHLWFGRVCRPCSPAKTPQTHPGSNTHVPAQRCIVQNYGTPL